MPPKRSGFTRLYFNKELKRIEDILEDKKIKLDKTVDFFAKKDVRILIDRFAVRSDDDIEHVQRIGDSVQTAFAESEGECIIDVIGKKKKEFNNRFELDGMIFLEPTHQLFNSNNPYGACPKCEGFGKTMGVDVNKVIPKFGM